MLGDVGQGDGPSQTRQRMARRNQQAASPAIQRDGGRSDALMFAGADDGQIDGLGFRGRSRRVLTEIGLADAQRRILGLQHAQHARQEQARLGLGGDDVQFAVALLLEIRRQGSDVVRLDQNAAGAVDHLDAGGRGPLQALALAYKDLKAQLVFQQFQLFGYARLGRVQTRRRRRDVEVRINHRDQIAKLDQRHRAGPDRD